MSFPFFKPRLLIKRFFSPFTDSLAANAFAMVFAVHALIVIPSRFCNDTIFAGPYVVIT